MRGVAEVIVSEHDHVCAAWPQLVLRLWEVLSAAIPQHFLHETMAFVDESTLLNRVWDSSPACRVYEFPEAVFIKLVLRPMAIVIALRPSGRFTDCKCTEARCCDSMVGRACSGGKDGSGACSCTQIPGVGARSSTGSDTIAMAWLLTTLDESWASCC